MMHLDELEVLAFADGERDDLREHVDACDVCARAVAEQVELRDALRASGLVEPPPLGPFVATLPPRPSRRLAGWPRLATILAPVAAGAIAIAVVTTRGGEQPARQADDATAMKAAPAQEDSSRAAAPPQLESAGNQLGRDFVLVFRTPAAAGAAATALTRAGFTIRIEKLGGEWYVNAQKRLAENRVAAGQAQVKKIGKRFGGRYAGGQ